MSLASRRKEEEVRAASGRERVCALESEDGIESLQTPKQQRRKPNFYGGRGVCGRETNFPRGKAARGGAEGAWARRGRYLGTRWGGSGGRRAPKGRGDAALGERGMLGAGEGGPCTLLPACPILLAEGVAGCKHPRRGGNCCCCEEEEAQLSGWGREPGSALPPGAPSSEGCPRSPWRVWVACGGQPAGSSSAAPAFICRPRRPAGAAVGGAPPRHIWPAVFCSPPFPRVGQALES